MSGLIPKDSELNTGLELLLFIGPQPDELEVEVEAS